MRFSKLRGITGQSIITTYTNKTDHSSKSINNLNNGLSNMNTNNEISTIYTFGENSISDEGSVVTNLMRNIDK